MSQVRLRHVAQINPPTLEFNALADGVQVTFLPLEAVWPGAGLDVSRTRPKAAVMTGYTRFREGDILVPKITPTFQGDRSTIVCGLLHGVGAGTTELHILRPGPDLDVRYADYLVSSRPFLQGGEAAMKGVAGQQRVPDEWLRDFSVLVPDPTWQQAIADFLDAETARIDALIAKKRQLAHLLSARYKEERRMRMLRGLNPITGAGLDVADWRTAQLGVLIGLQRGHDLPIDRRNNGTVPVISSGGPSGWHDVAAVMGPGVVTGRYGTVGEVYYVDGPYWPLNTTLYVHDFRGHDPRWIYHLLSVLPLDSDSAKSAVTGINRNVIGVLRVPVPPLYEQRHLAKEMDAKAHYLTSVTSRLNAQIRLLAEHRQALITAAVTGKLKVPGVAA